MKEFTVTGYRLNELTPAAQTAAFKEWLENNNDTFDGDYVVEDMIECARPLGIEIEHIYWSGFFQACFVGAYSYNPHWKKLLENYCPNYLELKEIGERLESVHNIYGEYSAVIYKTNYRNDHENSVEISVEAENEDNLIQLQIEVEYILKDFMREIYRRLQEEYEYSQSEANFQELANDVYDWYFTAEGVLLDL